MKTRAGDQDDYLRALAGVSLCPRCGQSFEGGLCPTPGCSASPAEGGPLGRRMSGMEWEQAWTPRESPALPSRRPQAPWDVSLPIFLPPAPAPRRPAGKILAGAIALLILMVAGATTFVTLRALHPGKPVAAPPAAVTFPATWDPRVQDLVDFVQRDRGLSFDHPVAVRFLTPEEYSAATRTSGPAQAGTQSEEGLFRALGLVSGSFDLGGANNQLADNGTLAFYSNETKDITVRGTDLTVGLRVTLAHELTHALQDQHFDLSRLQHMADSGQEFGFTSLVEGDAVRVEDDYVASLPAADRSAYQTSQDQAPAGLTGVPPALETLFGAPYVLGPELLKALLARGGNAAVDGAMRNPPLDELQVFDPWVYFAATPPAKLSEPALAPGEKAFDRGDFGAMSWFTVLTQRIDPHLALPAADAWGGDAYVGYTKGATSCTRADIAAATPAGVAPLMAAFGAWAQAMPAGSASVHPHGGGIEVDACDPGAAANLQPLATADAALVLPVFRSDFILGALASGAPLPFVRCSATAVVLAFSEADLADPTGANVVSTAGRARIAQAAAPCRSATG